MPRYISRKHKIEYHVWESTSSHQAVISSVPPYLLPFFSSSYFVGDRPNSFSGEISIVESFLLWLLKFLNPNFNWLVGYIIDILLEYTRNIAETTHVAQSAVEAINPTDRFKFGFKNFNRYKRKDSTIEISPENDFGLSPAKYDEEKNGNKYGGTEDMTAWWEETDSHKWYSIL